MFSYYDWSRFAAEDILVYLRKSRTDDPTMTVEEVLEKHESILDEWAEKNLGEKIPEKNKYREVVSGETIDDRPEIKKILKLVESPRYKAILIVEVQRLSRGDLEDAGRLIKLLRYSNTLVITPQKTYDLRDEYDRDAFERELKRGNEYLEYTKKILDRGRLLSVSQGNYLGSTAPYGYDRTTIKDGKKKCPTLKINEEEANVVRMIFDMYVNQGLGATAIANRLEALSIDSPTKNGRWNSACIFTILENVHYLGKVRWNWRKTIKTISEQEVKATRPRATEGEYLIYEGKQEAIISEELFKKAAEIRGSKPKTKLDLTLKNPLAQLVVCQTCGYTVGMNTYINNSVQFGKPKLVCNNQKRCKSGSAELERVIEDVKFVMREKIKKLEWEMEHQPDNSINLQENLIKQLEKELAALEKKELEQWELRSSGEMPKEIFNKLNEKLLADKEEKKQALCLAHESMPVRKNLKKTHASLVRALKALESEKVDGKTKNEYLKEIIDHIEYERPAMLRVKKADRASVDPSATYNGHGWYSLPYRVHVVFKEIL